MTQRDPQQRQKSGRFHFSTENRAQLPHLPSGNVDCLHILPLYCSPCSCTNVHFLGPNCQVEHWARLDLCMARHWQDWQVSMSMFKWCRPAVDQSETETDQMHLLQAKYLPLIISVATCSTLISNINFNCIMCNDELCGQTAFLRGSGTNVDESQAETDRMHLCSK